MTSIDAVSKKSEGSKIIIKNINCQCLDKSCLACKTGIRSIQPTISITDRAVLDSPCQAVQSYTVHQNPVHDSPQNSCNSDSANSNAKSRNSCSQSQLSSFVSHSETNETKSSLEDSKQSQECSSQLPKLAIPIRSQYHRLESTSVTEQFSQTNSNSIKHDCKQLHSSQSTFDTNSVSLTLFDKSYSQPSSTVSNTLTPTPLHALPHSSTDMSSSSNQHRTPPTPTTPAALFSPPLSPITPLTNTITPNNPAIKKARSKKSIDRVTGSSQYIYVAAHQICEAQEHEKRNELAEAVAKYREGVGTLLQGVQGIVILYTSSYVLVLSSIFILY